AYRSVDGPRGNPMKLIRRAWPAVQLFTRGSATGQNFYADSPPEPLALGRSLTSALANAGPGSLLELAVGDFDLGESRLEFPPGVTLDGRGPQLTRLLACWPQQTRCQFEFADGLTLRNLALVHNTTDPMAPGMAAGFSASGADVCKYPG